jgi:hypothetical protein
MGSFKGSLRIAATADVIDAVFLVDDHHLTVNTGGEALGSWPLSGLDPDDTGTEILMDLDGENVAVHALDHIGFAAAIASSKSKKKARHAKPKRSPKSERPKRSSRSLKPNRPPKMEKPKAVPKPEEPRRLQKSKSTKQAREWPRVIPFLRRAVTKDAWHEWLADRTVRWVLASAVVVTVAAFAVFATASLGMILVLLGMVALIVAALAVSDDLSAYGWIPGNLSEATLVIAGASSMAIGGLLIIIS